MKKATPKLVVRRETLRALADVELVQVGGGGLEARVFDTGAEMCNHPKKVAVP